MTTIDSLTVTIGIRHTPLLYVAAILYALDADRGGRLHRMANHLVDHCVTVT